MKAGPKQEQGFTLIEVLASIIILSIVSLVLTSYFINAMSYSKSNQNKTIMVNLARNALFYVEKQDFVKMQDYFITDKHPIIEANNCLSAISCTSYNTLFSNTTALAAILNPTVNKVEYHINIKYQAELHQNMLKGKLSESDEAALDNRKIDMAPFLIPVKVEVSGDGGPRGQAYTTVVEGYIIDEKIR